MNEYKQLILDDFYNNKVVKTKDAETEEFGIDDFYIKNFVNRKEKYESGGVEFSFSQGEKDNISCEGQKIIVNDYVEKLHFLGFAFWGAACDNIVITCEDMKKNFMLAFPDWAKKTWNDIRDIHYFRGFNIKTQKAYVITNDEIICDGYFHHLILEIGEKKLVKEIELPNNMFIHIFGITIEK